jgi:protocatechuate 3,4-dioxygenase beta subunit
VSGQPSDKGDATITGVVMYSDGRPAPNVVVTCRRSELSLSTPQLRNGDIDEYSDKVREFMIKTAKETRRASSGKDGAFRFSGLDATLSYDLHALEDAGGTGRQSRVAAGDSARIMLTASEKFRGKVLGPDGNPVTSFKVKAWPMNRQWEARTEDFQSKDGTFAMNGSGRMQVEASADGFSMDSPLDVEVKPDGPEVVLNLRQAAEVSGTVTDSSGKPLGGAVVTVGNDDNENNWRNWNQSQGARAYTDTRGRYKLSSLTPGETTLKATIGEMSNTQTMTLAAGDNTVDFSLDIGATLAVRLTDPNGKPVEADSIWFQADERNWSRPHKLPAKEPGLVEYAGLKPGEYTLTITAAGFPQIREKRELTDGRNELALKLANGAMLTGKVSTTSGSTLQNFSVRLRKEGDEQQGWGGWSQYGQVADDGTFKLGPVEPGQWSIELRHNNRGQALYKSTLNLAEGANTHNFSVDTGATLVVTVVDTQNNPVGRVSVNVRGERNSSDRTDGKGVATFAFLAAGSYTVTASGSNMASRELIVSLVNGENRYTLQVEVPNTARITHVYPDTQAAKAGVQVGDLIVEYNGQQVTSWREFSRFAREGRGTAELTMIVDRNGAQLTFTLKGGTVGIDGVDAVR